MPPSYDPARRLFFVTVRESCAAYLPVKEEIVPGRISNRGTVRRDDDGSYVLHGAIDPTNVERKWEFKYPTPTMAGTMSAGAGLVVGDGKEGNLIVFDGATGKD